MKKNSGAISSLIIGLILVLGFQNCSNSAFNQNEVVQEEPLINIRVDDGVYKQGMSFDYITTTANSTQSELKIDKLNDTTYAATAKESYSTCTVEIPNALEDLMQITDFAKVTHPSLLSDIDICEPIDGKMIHYKIGDKSPIYLVAHSQDSNCLTQDPQELMSENKRVFILENLSFEEIQSLIDDSQAIVNGASCATTTFIRD